MLSVLISCNFFTKFFYNSKKKRKNIINLKIWCNSAIINLINHWNVPIWNDINTSFGEKIMFTWNLINDFWYTHTIVCLYFAKTYQSKVWVSWSKKFITKEKREIIRSRTHDCFKLIEHDLEMSLLMNQLDMLLTLYFYLKYIFQREYMWITF